MDSSSGNKSRRFYISAALIALLMALIIGACGIVITHADDGAGEDSGPGEPAAELNTGSAANTDSNGTTTKQTETSGNEASGSSDVVVPEQSGGSSGDQASVGGGSDASGSGSAPAAEPAQGGNEPAAALAQAGGSDASGNGSAPAAEPAQGGSEPAAAPAQADGGSDSSISSDETATIQSNRGGTRGAGNSDASDEDSDSNEESDDNDESDEDADEEADETAPDPGEASIISVIESEQQKANVHKPDTFKNPEQDKKKTGSEEGSSITAGNSALQQAIISAFKKINGNTDSVTIQLTDGMYEGNVVISKKMLGTGTGLKQGFVLNIIAADTSRTANSKGALSAAVDGAGLVKFAGQIVIDSINVMLAGLSLEEGSAISVSGADLWFTGTTADDNVDVTLKNGARADIVTGEGDDSVSLAAAVTTANDDTPANNIDSVYAVRINTGDGDDTVSISESGLSYYNDRRLEMDVSAFG